MIEIFVYVRGNVIVISRDTTLSDIVSGLEKPTLGNRTNDTVTMIRKE